MTSPLPVAHPPPPPPPPPPLTGRPHVAIGSPTSPSYERQDHVPQPRLLTTSLTSQPNQGPTPVSATPTPSTTLSSPFPQATASPYSPYAPSPGGTVKGTSPMASRNPGSYSSAYNPQEWGPVASSPQLGTVPFPQAQQHTGQLRPQQVSTGRCFPFRSQFAQIWLCLDGFAQRS